MHRLAGAGLALPLAALALEAQVPETDVCATIVALEQATLDRGDPDAFPDLSDEDVVYFDPTLPAPIHGRDALRAYYHSWPPQPPTPGTMENVRVQVVGEVAVLTFNYCTKRDWNATEVYRRTPAGWRIIHTHWAYRQP